MFNKKSRRITAAMLAFSLVTAGTSLLPAITAHADNAYRQYEFIIDSTATPLTYGSFKYVKQNGGCYLTSLDAAYNTIYIPQSINGAKLKGVTSDFQINGNLSNISVETYLLDDYDYICTIKGILQKAPNLQSINYQPLFNWDGTINSYLSDDLKKVISALNAEDNEAITKAMKKYVSAKAKEITANCKTDYEKVKALHDWVINEVDYDDVYRNGGDFKYRIATDWTVFMNPDKVAICDGYARALTLLLQFSGFEAYYEGFGGHAATMVKLYGEFYHIDATWDDKGNGNVGYKYFLKGDGAYTDHTRGTANKYDEIEIKDGNQLLYILRFPSTLYKLPVTPFEEIRCNYSFGDFDGDNIISFYDVNYIDDIVEGNITPDERTRRQADFDQNGIIDDSDASAFYNEVKYLINHN